MKLTENLNVVDVLPLISPLTLRKLLPLSETASETVTNARKAIQQILTGKDKRLLVIVGPMPYLGLSLQIRNFRLWGALLFPTKQICW